jgi:4-hydroxyacetophenone monooxygenase
MSDIADNATHMTSGERRLLAEAVGHADLRVLLMVVFHLTGDRRWLKLQPKRDVKLVADEGAGLSPADQDAIRSTAVSLLSKGAQPKVIDPGDDLMVEMMTVCLGERVPPEYATLMREELGFTPRDVAWRHPESALRDRHEVVIVGAGASGIALSARLERLGISYTVVERHEEVGGVWLENRYPGAGVDTPSHAYSYSFGPRYQWPRYFSAREHIHDYLRRSAEEFSILPNIRFNTVLRRAKWDAHRRKWSITIESSGGEETFEARILVSAIGQFGEPSIPDIQGAADFKGPIFHSAKWPEELSLQGRRVAVIGTGASAMQIVPTIADQVSHLAVFQRTPQWARPVSRYHDPIPEPAQWLMRHVPSYASWFRFSMWWRYGDGLLPQIRRDPNWPHQERSINRRNDLHREEMTTHIQDTLKGRKDLIDKSVPSYPPFAKRILLDNGWYEAIAKPNVELVIKEVAQITPDGVETGDGQHRAVDAIIWATGFSLAPLAARLDIVGRNDQTLRDAWKPDNPTAYLGIAVPGFPNFFMMGGPNTGLAHGGSTMFQAECQARYISGMVVRMAEEGLETCEVTTAAHDDFVRKVDAEHEQLIWSHPGVSSYYKNSSGRIFSAMPFRLVDYWIMTHEPNLDVYHTEKDFC